MDFEDKAASDLLAWAVGQFAGRFAIVTSFQAEGMVLLHMAARIAPAVRVITIDTGRLPGETHEMMDAVRARYPGIHLEVLQPDAAEVASMVTRHGADLFYDDVSLRNLCCNIRKVRPLNLALRGVSAYAVGLRREQSESRHQVPKAEREGDVWKLSPLADWSHEAVWSYVREHDLPVHPLYSRGYQSIGCAPCTRAIEAGEDERAGRWWWEQDAAKECGLHFTPEGKVARKLDVMLAEVLSS